jgi:hypothetical protein
VVDALEDMKLAFPKVSEAQKKTPGRRKAWSPRRREAAVTVTGTISPGIARKVTVTAFHIPFVVPRR